MSVLGLFRIETENMRLWEILLFLFFVMGFIVGLILLLRGYALPTLSVLGIKNKIQALLQLFKSREP